MIKELLKKISDWTLEKEEELAKNCQMPIETIDKQINTLKSKKTEVLKQVEEIDKLIARLEKIKNTELLRCNK